MNPVKILSVLALLAVNMTRVMAGKVLILGTSVSGGMSSAEAQAVVLAGHTPEVVDASTWGSMTTAQFSSYEALVLGDPFCSSSLSSVAAAEANKHIWGPAVTGNIFIDGTDPVLHRKPAFTNGAVAFAVAEEGTGLYTSLSCYYHGAPVSGVPVSVLSHFGDFKVRGVGCYNDVHKVADHPALAGVTDASLSNWSCSVHEAFTQFPSSFLPLAIARNVADVGSLSFPDGSFGVPYVIARGKTLVPVACGNGIVEEGEECDDGNVLNGDGCSAQCKKEVPVVEITCPTAQVVPSSTSSCDAVVETTALVTATSGASVTFSPAGPYPVGTTTVTATASLLGSSKTCTFDVTVEDKTAPVIGDVKVDTGALWPPNHKMVLVNLAYEPSDNCGTSSGVSCMLMNPVSSESDNALGDGNTTGDIVITSGEAKKVLVRSERSGKGKGRSYGVTVMCKDSTGNVSEKSVTFAGVPKSQSGK